MKKLFVAIALVMGTGSSMIFAENISTETAVVAAVNEFKPIEVKDLPQAVQAAITKNYAEQTIKEAAVEVDEEGGKIYKVVLVNAENEETTAYFNENGDELK